ncbi:MAG: acyl-CoA synthetase [Rhodospirillales bacterium]|nr:acyl-CoA synthetase [Rhodospirillales bacterium]MBO6785931.1 acyl-CoA synthetase [Rhodospirillales bacterium]
MRMIVWGLLILMLLLIVALPTVMLVGFGMMPGLVAMIIDRTEERSATFCVGGLNFCGVFPYLMELWFGDHDLGQAMALLTDVFVLAVMYGGACMGWMLYLSLPPVIASFIQVMSERRLQQLRKTQRDILQEWGDEVITDADLGGDGLMPPEHGAASGMPAAAE